MVDNEDWEYGPAKATRPGMAAKVMGPNHPRGYYTTKADFEAEGVKKSISPHAK